MCSYLCILCCPHAYGASTMATNIIKQVSDYLSHIQPKFQLDVWNGSIRYDEIIKKELVQKIRKALKTNKINTLFMNMTEEYYYIEQIAFYLYTRILTNYCNNNLKEFQLVKLEYSVAFYKIPSNVLNSVETRYIDHFRNHIVQLKTHNLDLNTKDKSEQTIFQEKLQNIILNILEQINMEDIFWELKHAYEEIKNQEQLKTEQLRNLI